MRGWWIAAVASLVLAAPAAADAPAYLPVQGVLADAEGLPVTGDVVFRFALYESDLGGSELWTELQTVHVEQGLFTVYLGDDRPLDLALFRDHDGLWLGVTIGGDPEMGRLQIATTGYAAFAQYAGDAASLGGVPASNYRTTSTPVGWSDLTGVPPDLADGDSDTTYSAGAGLTLTGTTFAVDRTTVEGWARGVCYDTAVELRRDLDTVYAPVAHSHAWSSITGIPAGFADGIDDVGAAYVAGAGISIVGNTIAVNFGGGGTAATAARSDHNHDATYVNEGQPDSITSAMVASDALTNADLAPGACGSSEVFNTSATNAVLHYGATGLLGGANTWAPNSGGNGVWIEGSDGEGGGFFANGNMAAIWSPTDATVNLTNGTSVGSTLLALYDEDDLPGTAPFNTASFVFSDSDTRRIAVNNGAYLSNGGIWTNTSARDLKENIRPVDVEEVLERLARLPIARWSYKSERQLGNFEHMGPMADDFHAAFGLGYDARSIPTVDVDGVALAAIQALYRRNQELERRAADLEARVDRLQRLVESLAAR